MRFSEDRLATYTSADGQQRAIHIWEPESPKAVFVAVHGGMANAGDYVTPALWFKQRGWATVAHDMSGHVNVKRVKIASFDHFLDDLASVIAWTKTAYPGLPLVVMAHSMGGLIATHYGLRRQVDPAVKGYVMSAPYWANAIKTPAIVERLAGVLARVAPNMTVPIEDFSAFLTHDDAIMERIRRDKADMIRAKEPSARFAFELLKAQQWLPDQIANWRHPLLVAIAGHDKLADSAVTQAYVAKIDPRWVDAHLYPDNFHENLNERNREEIYTTTVAWARDRLGIV